MPELVDLEAVREVLDIEVAGRGIEHVSITHPIAVRCRSHQFFREHVEGRRIEAVGRRGKFLFISLDDRTVIVINPMLAGRVQLCAKTARPRKSTCLQLTLDDGREVRYFDERQMGKIYLAVDGDFSDIPQLNDLGPDALSPDLTKEGFIAQMKRFRAPIKSVLTNQRCLAGIGNAYADEILFEAGISPLRRRASLSPEDLDRLYEAMLRVFRTALEEVRRRLGRDIHIEHREFMKVHRRDATTCQRCGNRLTVIGGRSRPTVFCRRCQP